MRSSTKSFIKLINSMHPDATRFLGLAGLQEGCAHVQGFQLPTSLCCDAEGEVASQLTLHWGP